ncbi:MAG TPA: hypothetical protein VI670_28630 [Thermoanaerobaculia bacterium]
MRKTLNIVLALTFLSTVSAQAASRTELHDTMRKLWEDHVTWTRIYIIDAAAGSPETQLTAQRLLQNQADLGNAVATVYGRAAGDKLTALLRDHILTAADLVTAAKAGDQAKVAAAKTKWYANANDIAVFLNGANPKWWALPALQSAMKTHLDQTLDEATHQLQGKYSDSIRDYEGIVNHILMMADLLTNGIVAQFPEKFDRP